MKDRTKQLVLKRDNYKCRNCGSTENLHVHHEYGYYGNLRAKIPLQNWPWRNFKQQMITLCGSCHAKRTQDQGTESLHGTIVRDSRNYLIELDPDYFSQFDVLGGT